MPDWVALTVAAILLLFALGTGRRALDLARLIARLRRMEPMPIRAPGPSLRLVHGRLDGPEPLASPYQKRPCLYYFFRVLDLTVTPNPKSVATGKEWTKATIRDDSGKAGLEPWTPVVGSPRRFETRHDGLTTIPPQLATFFERAGIDEKHLARLPSIGVQEYTLEPGDEVFVLGTLDAEENRFVRARRRPYAVTAERDIGLADALRNELVLYAIVAPLLLVAGIAVGALAFAG